MKIARRLHLWETCGQFHSTSVMRGDATGSSTVIVLFVYLGVIKMASL